MKNIKPKRKGRPPLSGAYSLMVRAGELLQNRRYIRAFLSAARAGLIKDLGPTEQGLTTAQLILVDRVICKLGVLRCIEEHIRETGVMRGQNLAPVLQDSYGHYSNAVRLDLVALGIKTRAGEGVLDLGTYLREHDKKKSQAKPRKALRTGSEATTAPRTGDPPSPDHVNADKEAQGSGAIDCDIESDQDQGSEGKGIGQPEPLGEDGQEEKQ